MDTQEWTPPTHVDSRADFFAAMSSLQEAFAAAAVDIDAREAALQETLADIRRVLQDGVGETVLARSHPLARFMTDFNVELADILRDWLNQIEKHDRNTAFRKGFTDSLVVFVLGKVKAGKSSLGNYMAYGRSNPEEVAITATGPHFFIAAMAHGADNQSEFPLEQGRYFRVGARETTRSIQGFRIPGLTWVDSPGLHSATPENGALASDYADVADLIVYPIHTGNPGRTGDVAEIQRLLRENKRFVVVITQCDKPEEDEAPDGTIVQRWVMKDRDTRQGQIDYVRRAVSAAKGTAPLDILSLSVRYAETQDNDPAALEEGGVADFFRLLTDIAQSEGVRRKRETPSRNLDHFVDLVLDGDASSSTLSVAHVRTRLRDLEEKLTGAAAELDRHAANVAAAVVGRIGALVADKIERHAGDKNQAAFQQECTDALRQIVAEETGRAIHSLLATKGRTLVPVANLVEISGFLKFESLTVKITKSNRKTIGAVGGAGGGALGLWAGAELGAAAGSIVPGIGNIIGGVIGGALGAFLGSAAGTGAGEAIGSDWEESMQSGDNRDEVEASAVKALREAGQVAVWGFFASMKAAAIKPVEQRAAQLVRELEQFSKILETRVRSNGRSVPARV